jgi:hypothetical protein
MRNADEAAQFFVQGSNPHKIPDSDKEDLLDSSFTKETNINIEVQ